MAFGGCRGQDLTMTLGGIIDYLRQAVPHYRGVFSSASLYCAHILLLLFLFHLSTTYLLILVVPGASGCLRLSQGVVPCPCYVAPDRTHHRLALPIWTSTEQYKGLWWWFE